MRILALALAPALSFAACGTSSSTCKTNCGTHVVTPMTPQDAVAEVKLDLPEAYATFYYCDQPYPQTCDSLPMAYVLPRGGTEPFRLVFFNNQDRNSTWATFDYILVNPDTREVATQGHFKWHMFQGQVERQGTPLWGVPE